MKTIEYLTKAELLWLRYSEYEGKIPPIDLMLEGVKLGKKLAEELKPKLWEASNKKFLFDCSKTFTNFHNAMIERHCNTKEEARRRLKMEQQLNIINAWILEDNEKYGLCVFDYYLEFDSFKNEYSYWHGEGVSIIGQEATTLGSIERLIKLLNSGLIKGIPKP